MKLSRLCRCGCNRPIKKPGGQFATVGCNLRMRSPEQRRQWSREGGLARQRNWEGRLVDACAKLPTFRESHSASLLVGQAACVPGAWRESRQAGHQGSGGRMNGPPSTAVPPLVTILDQVRTAFLQHRLPIGDELACQRTCGLLLEQLGIAAEREFRLAGQQGRIDFYLPEPRIGIELKVKGSPSAVLRQLLRYAESPEVEALVLVTGRAKLAQDLPATLAGKPFHVICTWRSGL